MRVPPMENSTCTAFEEYEEVPETVPLYLLEDNVTWVASKLSGAAGALGVEAIELRNWILRFGCALEEFRVIVADLEDWMANYSHPLDTYHNLMACRLVALDTHPGLCPIGIRETLRQAIAKIVMRAAGDQEKTVCGSIQLCTGIEAGIEGATHDVAQRRQERSGAYPGEKEDKGSDGAEDEGVAEPSGMARSGEAARF